jgi:hypothetical protein
MARKRKNIEIEQQVEVRQPPAVIDVSNGVTTVSIIETDLKNWEEKGWKKL